MKGIRIEPIQRSNEYDYTDFVNSCSCALVQHTLPWRDIISDIGEDEPIYFLARQDETVAGVLPAFLFRCELGDLMISVPQAGGYGGVVVEQGNPRQEDIYAALLNAFRGEAEARGCVLATICTAPFFAELNLYRKYFAPHFELANLFQYSDLSLDFHADWDEKRQNALRENIRRNIKTAKKNNLEVRLSGDAGVFSEWYGVYEKRMRHVGGTPLPRSLLDGIRRRIVHSGHGFCTYVYDKDILVGGSIFVGHNQVIDYFMGACDPDHMKKQPNSLLMFTMLESAQQHGYRYWNWQSCSSRDSSLYHYKAGWGAHEGTHYYLTRVVRDISRLRHTPLSAIKEQYKWHYVMPYTEFH